MEDLTPCFTNEVDKERPSLQSPGSWLAFMWPRPQLVRASIGLGKARVNFTLPFENVLDPASDESIIGPLWYPWTFDTGAVPTNL